MLAAELSHARAPAASHDVDQDGKIHFIVMEYVGGPSLRTRCNEQPDHKLPPDVAIGYMLEVLPALGNMVAAAKALRQPH